MPLHGQTVSSSLNTVAILAPGLIGGSLALALGQQKEWEIRIWARDSASIHQAEKLLRPSLASQNFGDIIPGAKIVVLCTPVSVMGRLARQIQPMLDQDAVVTDVGSVKATVMGELVPLLGDRFVGGHPMAGSERSGLEAARPDLFRNAMCILTPAHSSENAKARLQAVCNLWRTVGAQTREMSSEAHDVAMAFISHLPHAAAAALVNTVKCENASLQELAGGGYRDTTRIAEGSPDLWMDIFLENRDPLLMVLSNYIQQLQSLSHFLQRTDATGLRTFLEEASTVRARVSNG